jgi:hypothetical protein
MQDSQAAIETSPTLIATECPVKEMIVYLPLHQSSMITVSIDQNTIVASPQAQGTAMASVSA